ncbi:hypothetical protein V6N13_096353 [Hibiscus sabdariffa]|uniref:Uncharacterized protein n=1 Tax=Hibiscus sabdariffa TaxID=183260 RepID=A0ABR2DH23_9ROSI
MEDSPSHGRVGEGWAVIPSDFAQSTAVSMDQDNTSNNHGVAIGNGIPTKVSFKDMVMRDMAMETWACSIEDLDVDVIDDDVVIKEGLIL